MTAPRIAVDPWDPGFGTATATEILDDSTARLNVDFEIPGDQWSPRDVSSDAWEPEEVLIVDGVRRIDARVWFTTDTSPAPDLGIAASFAAGVVRLDGSASVVESRVERAVFTACAAATELQTSLAKYAIALVAAGDANALSLALQRRMNELEVAVSFAHRNDNDLLILDGPLRGRATIPRTVGYIKTHHTSYLPAKQNDVVASLGAGQRTPVFTIGTTWSRQTWYLKLPVVSDFPWAGIVRCECGDALSRDEAVGLADTTTTIPPRLASMRHRDPRAPQNLVPIGGLEKFLGTDSGMQRSCTEASPSQQIRRPAAYRSRQGTEGDQE